MAGAKCTGSKTACEWVFFKNSDDLPENRFLALFRAALGEVKAVRERSGALQS